MSRPSWFARALAPWYASNRRTLPWRGTRDPYMIWLSEVILQQTRVDQGLAYFQRFAGKYPTVTHLARANEEEVLKDWQGLGYYTRARNMLATARQVVSAHAAVFPATSEGLLALKGIGPYTARAIASIAFGEPVAVVDGNVYRVLSRFFGLSIAINSTEGRRTFGELAAQVLDENEPGTHNEAVMELGALICRPRSPRCGECPLSTRCQALSRGLVDRLPVKEGRARSRDRHFNYLVPEQQGPIWLVKRTSRDIWQGLYEPPLVEAGVRMGRVRLQRALDERLGRGWSIGNGPVDHRHVLSHQVIHARFWRVRPPHKAGTPVHWTVVGPADLERYPVPRLVERALEMTGINT